MYLNKIAVMRTYAKRKKFDFVRKPLVGFEKIFMVKKKRPKCKL